MPSVGLENATVVGSASFFRELGTSGKIRYTQHMNGALKKAFQEAAQLPEDEQAEFAEWLLAELADERRWRKTFADSQDMLSAMADEALAEAKRGEVKDLDFGKH